MTEEVDEPVFDAVALRAARRAKANQAANRANAIKHARAGTLNDELHPGKKLMKLVKELAAQRMPATRHKYLSVATDCELKLVIHPRKSEEKSQLFVVPSGATLTRYSYDRYTLEIDRLSVRFKLDSGRLVLIGHSGFKTPKHARPRTSSGGARQVVRSAS